MTKGIREGRYMVMVTHGSMPTQVVEATVLPISHVLIRP